MNESVELRPSYAIPSVLAVVGIPLWFFKFWAVASVLLIFSLFLTVQTATLRLVFSPTDLDIYRGNSLIRKFPYKDWQNWQIFWQPIPILFYFKEIKSIHFLPIIFNAQTLKACLEEYCSPKLSAELPPELPDTKVDAPIDPRIDALRLQLKSEEYGERMQALAQSRNLSISDRFEFVSIGSGDRNTRIRYDAVSQLATIGNHDLDKSLEILRDRLLNDPEMDVKAAAADAIGALKLTEAFTDLQKVYKSTNDWLMQFSIVAALGELGDVRGFELLADALTNNSNDLVKIAAIGALGELRDPRSLDLLLPSIDNPDWQIRHRLAQALANIGTEPAIAALKKLTTDPKEQVAEIAKILLPSS